MRESKGLLLEDAAAVLDCHIAKISRIELGHSGVRSAELKELLRTYGVTEDEWPGFLALAKTDRKRRWSRDLEDKLPTDFLDLIGLEADVSTLRIFHPSMVVGLFQTEDYATSVIQGGRVGPLDDERRTKVRVRLERQRVLTREVPLEVRAVLGEGALRQMVGGADVMRTQLLHLVEVAQMPTVTIQVLPFSAGAYPGGPLPFLIYGFPPPSGLEVVTLEYLTGHLYLENPDETDHFARVFEELRAVALSPLESQALMNDYTDRLTSS
ncbi:helix-turn-helix transcriptional regulator [Yinghuangia sp. KLBMP8922]|uniref:Helix-turn-helix transcriptional regulator n=1 Tax=Yinghuangia soli TaxID=2908204 RepID=A0AA41Q591_9ACTN|nr:helix-turn-helix transcriptional regulator [Yinghuangia soli]